MATKQNRDIQLFKELGSFKLVRELIKDANGSSKVQRQRRIPGLRRWSRSISLHPDLMTELLWQAAAEGVSPQLWLARRLSEQWNFRKEDV